jgi:hypothetical protein
MDWLWKQLLVTWCLANIQWIQLFALAFVFGIAISVAVLSRRSAIKTIKEVNNLKETLRNTQSSVSGLTTQIKQYHPDGTKCKGECDHDHTVD